MNFEELERRYVELKQQYNALEVQAVPLQRGIDNG